MCKIFKTTYNHANFMGDDIMNRDTSNVFDAARYLLQDPPMRGDSVHESKPDMVNSPSHYKTGKIECIEAMEAMLSKEEFIGYLRGNAFKYQWRFLHKGKAKEDLAKAKWYLDRLTNFIEL